MGACRRGASREKAVSRESSSVSLSNFAAFMAEAEVFPPALSVEGQCREGCVREASSEGWQPSKRRELTFLDGLDRRTRALGLQQGKKSSGQEGCHEYR